MGELDLNSVKDVMKNLIRTVLYMHDQNVCHRDLKPDNIFIEPGTNAIKLIDFNVAVKLQTPTLEEPYPNEIRGSTGLKEWNAPETRTVLYYSAKCDMWSLGCLLHYMLSRGKFHGDSELIF